MRFIGKVVISLLLLVGIGEAQTIRHAQIKGFAGRVFNVIDYGATGDGLTDDTAAIQRAVTAALVAGGKVDFPRGNFKITSSLVINRSGVVLQGCGLECTIVTSTQTSGYVISYQAVAGGALDGGAIQDMTIVGPGASTGTAWAINVAGTTGVGAVTVSGHIIQNVSIRSIPNAIRHYYSVSSLIQNFFITNIKPLTGIGIEFGLGHDRIVRDGAFYNGGGGGTAWDLNAYAGINVLGSTGDFFHQLDIIGMGNGIRLDSTSEDVIWGEIVDCLIDSGEVYGIYIYQGAHDLNLWGIRNVWISTNTEDGIYIDGASAPPSGIQILGGEIRGINKHGVYVKWGDTIQISNVNFAYTSAASSGTYDAIKVDRGSRIQITNNLIGATSGDLMGYGINLTGALSDQITVVGNHINAGQTGRFINQTGNNDMVFEANWGVSEASQIVASAASITIGEEPTVKLSGTTTVATINGTLGYGRTIYIQATDASPASPTLSETGNIVPVLTLRQNEIATCTYSVADAKWHCTTGTPSAVKVSLSAQGAALTSANLLTTAPAGTYRISAYLHTTTASSGACTSNVTIGWTFNGGAKSANIIVTHDQNTDENFSTGSAVVRVDASSNIERAIDLTGTCSNAVYSVSLVVEKLI